MAFAHATHAVERTSKRLIPSAPWKSFAGGLVITVAVFSLGTTKYIGLGLPTIAASFQRIVPSYDFAGKFLFTSFTLGTGFKGGEVTPLFYIGATLGNALSHILPLPPSLLAAIGFVAVFAGAANTPITSTFMALELFGGEAGAYAAIACIISYIFSGHSGIYHSQKVGRSKHPGGAADEGMSLALVAKTRDEAPWNPLEEINDFGFLEGAPTVDLRVLRLYFSASQMRSADSWWQRFTPISLGEYLLQQAKEHGIEQALLNRVIGGFLDSHELTMDSGEIQPTMLPQCLELVGDEKLLQSFLKDNEKHLERVRVVFLRGEEVHAQAALGKEQLSQTLDIQQAGRSDGADKPEHE
jgi:PII-like signaling protein